MKINCILHCHTAKEINEVAVLLITEEKQILTKKSFQCAVAHIESLCWTKLPGDSGTYVFSTTLRRRNRSLEGIEVALKESSE